MRTNLLINNLVKLEKNQDYSDVTISIETIDKRKAVEYLEKNFKFNRVISRKSIDNYASQMRNGDWVLVDAGDIIVHLFRSGVREYYGLEKMWAGEEINSYIK